MRVEPAKVLELLRPLVMVVDGFGTITATHGGCGGFLGYDLAALVGTNVLTLVDPAEQEDIASYFIAAAGETLRTTLLPLPFRVRMIDASGINQAVDVIPTGRPDDPDVDGWVVALVPLAMQAGPSRSLDAELSGAPRATVKQLLAEELEIDNADWVTRLFLVDLPSRVVTGGRRDQEGLLPVIARAVATGWSPWQDAGWRFRCVRRTDRHRPAVRAGARPRRRMVAGRVGTDRPRRANRSPRTSVSAAHTTSRRSTASARTSRRGSAASSTSPACCTANGATRTRSSSAATTDPLTGLANRDALTKALATAGHAVAVAYIDIDHFKAVNDGWGSHRRRPGAPRGGAPDHVGVPARRRGRARSAATSSSCCSAASTT